MPLFEFHCPACGKDFDELVQLTDDISAVACPACGGTTVERKLSVFAAHSTSGAQRCPLSSPECGRCCDSGESCELM